jgi:PST family polysaccharide transporter
VQEDPAQLRKYFLGIYAMFASMTLPITMMCGLFAEDLVAVFLGGQWHEAAGVFRRLAPAIMVYGLINPFSWLMFAIGRVKRSLNIAFVIAPVVILAYGVGLSGGPKGVALAYSLALIVLALPVVYWSRRGTAISMGDVFRAVAFPGAAAVVAAGVAVFGWVWIGRFESPLIRLMAGCSVVSIAYLVVLLFVFGQLRMYLGQLRHVGFLSRWLPADVEAA